MSKNIIEGKGWENWHDWQSRVMTPVTTFFCEATRLRPGSRLLDAACGTGIPLLDLAPRVLPGGQVTAIDISDSMLSAAQRKASALNITNISFARMDVAQLDYGDESFDVVTCKDGLIYCKEPVLGARELRRVLAPSGRFAISAWDEPRKNPFFTSLFQVVSQFVKLPPSAPDAPGPFRLASAQRLSDVLQSAGFSEISIVSREVIFEFDSVDMHWQVVRDMAAPLSAASAVLSSAEMDRLRRAMADALVPFTDETGRVRINNTALCASGTR